MKERPILFSAPMVRAILEGRKTQTRRALRDQSPIDLGAAKHGTHLSRREVHDHGKLVGHRMTPVHCPYGQPGDRLWVRESWSVLYPQYIKDADEPTFYKADAKPGEALPPWRPSIHMPRDRCRLVLVVIDVRVERVQNISEADCLAEGIQIPMSAETKRPLLRITGPYPPANYFPTEGMDDARAAGKSSMWLRAHYASLWDSLNAIRGYSWQTNPWVWVVEFKPA